MHNASGYMSVEFERLLNTFAPAVSCRVGKPLSGSLPDVLKSSDLADPLNAIFRNKK